MDRRTLEYSRRFPGILEGGLRRQGALWPHLRLRLAVALTCLAAGLSRAGEPSIPDVRLADAFPGVELEKPLWLTHAGDGSGRLFVILQDGRIQILRLAAAGSAAKPSAKPLATPTLFLDISEKVRRVHTEEGLLALAFAPDYGRSGAFYVFYSASDPHRNVLARYKVSKGSPDRADPGSEQVLLEVEKRYGNHNGSTILFGPDGYLYVSLGDGGGAGDPFRSAQDLGSLLGKILRIDVSRHDPGLPYAIPRDNPFVSMSGARPEIWAYGLRNVWRMSFDAKTGDLLAGDVGQDSREEIDLVKKGGNYGWSLREGKIPFREGPASAALLDPVVDYGRKEGACVTGGYVYRGALQKGLLGVYLYADFVTGNIWGLRMEGDRVLDQKLVLRQPKNIASFGEGPDGEIFVCAFDGHVYHIEEVPAK